MPDTIMDAPALAPGASDALARICAETLRDVASKRQATPIQALEAKAASREPPRGFTRALTSAAARHGVGLIAEIKRASPSGGPIREDLNPAEMAVAYQTGGAACLSVLTEGPHFGGSPEDLRAARVAVPLPALRKDFMLDPWQIYESRAMGVDCVLLIMAALADSQARELEDLARSLDLDVLVEVHDRAELDRALGLNTPLVGINNRNLKTLRTSLETTEELAPHVPADRFLVAESGIRSHADLVRLRDAGAQGFLVGESLLRQPDLTGATRALLGTG